MSLYLCEVLPYHEQMHQNLWLCAELEAHDLFCLMPVFCRKISQVLVLNGHQAELLILSPGDTASPSCHVPSNYFSHDLFLSLSYCSKLQMSKAAVTAWGRLPDQTGRRRTAAFSGSAGLERPQNSTTSLSIIYERNKEMKGGYHL